MKLRNVLINALFFIMIVFGCISQTFAENDKAIPIMKVLWQKEVATDTNLNSYFGPVAFDKSTNRILMPIISFHPRGSKNNTEDKLWLFEVEPNSGDIAKKAPIKDLSESKILLITASSVASSITMTENNEVALMGKFDGLTAPMSIMKINQNGNTNKYTKFSSKNNSEKEFSQFLNKTNPSGGNLLLISKNKSSITNIDSEGKILWERNYKIGQKSIDSFSDGLIIGDKGDFALVGCSANPAQPRSPFPDLTGDDFIVRCNAQGDVMAKDIFTGNPWPGEQPQICQISSGNFVVVFGKGTAMSDINIRVYSPDLKLLWEKPVIKANEKPFSSFKIAATRQNNFVIAVNIDFGNLRVFQYNENGNTVANLSKDKEIGLGNIGLICNNNKAYVIYQTSLNLGQGETLSRIKMTALELQ